MGLNAVIVRDIISMDKEKVDILHPETEPICPIGSLNSYLYLRRDAFRLSVPYGRNSGEIVESSDKIMDSEEGQESPSFHSLFLEAAANVKSQLSPETYEPQDSASNHHQQRPDGMNWTTMLQTSHHSRDPLVHQLLNRHCENKSDQSLKLGFNGSTFMIPPRSAFLISDISTFSFQLESTQFGLVVADPPWPNLSASRSNSYDTMDPYHLFKIPLQSHLAEGAVVVVWITHKPKYRAFVIEKLFSAWGLEFVAEWCWIKTTTKGEPMFDDSLKNRKSYELLLIGRRRYRDVQRQQEVVPIPKLKFFASVPSTNHSQKPFLDSLLAPYLPKDSAKLELFARIVRSDWVCWGNECLKFNEVCFLEER